jgi:hypothetical protein
MTKNLSYIIGGTVLFAGIGIIYYLSTPSDDTSSIKEPRSANNNVSNYRKGIINNYWEDKYPGTQSGGSKRKRKIKPKTKTKKR